MSSRSGYGRWSPARKDYGNQPAPDRMHGSSIREDSDLNADNAYKADYRYDANKWESPGSSIGGSRAFERSKSLRAARAAKAAELTLRYRGASQGRQFGRNAAMAAERQEAAENEPDYFSPSAKRIAKF